MWRQEDSEIGKSPWAGQEVDVFFLIRSVFSATNYLIMKELINNIAICSFRFYKEFYSYYLILSLPLPNGINILSKSSV